MNEPDEIYRIVENEFGFMPEFRPRPFLQGLISGWHSVFLIEKPFKTFNEAKDFIEKWKKLAYQVDTTPPSKKVKSFTKYHYID